jgi:multiple antibiotic resistance protein
MRGGPRNVFIQSARCCAVVIDFIARWIKAWAMDIEFIKNAFITLFVALDPPGLIAIFLGLTAHMSLADRKATSYRAVIVAFGILVAAAIAGKTVLESLSISMPAFSIAGGLLLFYIAFEMVFEKREPRKSHAAEEAIIHDHPKNIAVFPLAIPLMAGPGAITATILQASKASGHLMNQLALIGVLAAVIGCCLVSFLLANQFDRILGSTGRIVVSRRRAHEACLFLR